jgi:hypothetical protein
LTGDGAAVELIERDAMQRGTIALQVPFNFSKAAGKIGLQDGAEDSAALTCFSALTAAGSLPSRTSA